MSINSIRPPHDTREPIRYVAPVVDVPRARPTSSIAARRGPPVAPTTTRHHRTPSAQRLHVMALMHDGCSRRARLEVGYLVAMQVRPHEQSDGDEDEERKQAQEYQKSVEELLIPFADFLRSGAAGTGSGIAERSSCSPPHTQPSSGFDHVTFA
eukprot:CAMPEP_0170168358 /NCGR_PEP_ID=MMETSP0040_2-20121228/1430_1 /TAXON_ID=641309 /ORGANISM="Lotharella oceanica, Strain CCMP622" /LENGTH=153 /DNA_ID=CAMNT_0010406589 /DNA_START=44 /DNA_END=506 /DNA_ORIENTATION=+